MTSDVGVHTTLKIIERIEERVARDKYLGTDELNSMLKEEIVNLLEGASKQHKIFKKKAATIGDIIHKWVSQWIWR